MLVADWKQLFHSTLSSINIIYIYVYIYIIQIKICAEYRDMLPRPRLVCQEPGLRPMSRYSAQILICFIAYIFLICFIPLWVWLGTLQDCQYAQWPLPLSIVIKMSLVIRQSKLPACLAEVQLAHQNTPWHLSHSLVKRQIKWMKSVSMESFQHKNQVNAETLAYMWVILFYSSLESRLVPVVLEGQVRLFWNWLGQEFDSCHIAAKLEFESIFQAVLH